MNFFTLDKSVFSFIKESDRRKSAVSFNNKYILEIRRISKFDTLLCKAAVNFVFNLINGNDTVRRYAAVNLLRIERESAVYEFGGPVV